MRQGPHSEALHEDERRADELYAEFHEGKLHEAYGKYCYDHGEPLSWEFLRDYVEQEREAEDGLRA
jgi:hypothetical protein